MLEKLHVASVIIIKQSDTRSQISNHFSPNIAVKDFDSLIKEEVVNSENSAGESPPDQQPKLVEG